MQTYILAAEIQPLVAQAVDFSDDGTDEAIIASLTRAQIPYICVNARAHRQFAPHETTLLGISAGDIERANIFRRSHNDGDALITIVGGRAVRVAALDR